MREYIDSITKPEDYKNDPRIPEWEQEQEKYGFDSRDTWCLDITMLKLLYERLKMFSEKSTIVDHDSDIVKIDGIEYSMSTVITNLINLGETIITEYYNIDSLEDEDNLHNLQKEFWNIWAQSFYKFWW